MKTSICIFAFLFLLCAAVLPAASEEKYDPSVPRPTMAEVRYGPHERNVLDFWQASSDEPTPLVFVIHGGGWMIGSKERVHRSVDVSQLLENGISVVAINYRYISQAKDVSPPVQAPVHDAARALQFVRSKAGEWNIDKSRVGAVGGSAGACTSLWLAYHDDLADPASSDPVARESTRLLCVAAKDAQTTLDPVQMKAWIPNSRYGGHAFGKKDFAQFLAERDSILPWIFEYSPYYLASPDDPPVALFYRMPPAMGQPQEDPEHSANFGAGVMPQCRALGLECEFVYPGAPDVKHATTEEYLMTKLRVKE